MKKFIFISSVLSLVLSGCNGQSIIEDKNIVVDNIETVELAKANEENEESAIVDTVAKNTITLTEEELEALIDKRVEEKIASLNIKDGIDGKDGINGKDGKDGVGIAGVAVDENGDLVVALTNGVIANVGHVKGEKGDTGAQGSQGEKGDKGDKGESSGDGVVDDKETPDYMKAGYIVPINNNPLPLTSTYRPYPYSDENELNITVNSISIRLKDNNPAYGSPFEYEVTIGYHKELPERITMAANVMFGGPTIIYSDGRGETKTGLAIGMENIAGTGDGTFTYTLIKGNPIKEINEIVFSLGGLSANNDPIDNYVVTN